MKLVPLLHTHLQNHLEITLDCGECAAEEVLRPLDFVPLSIQRGSPKRLREYLASRHFLNEHLQKTFLHELKAELPPCLKISLSHTHHPDGTCFTAQLIVHAQHTQHSHPDLSVSLPTSLAIGVDLQSWIPDERRLKIESRWINNQEHRLLEQLISPHSQISHAVLKSTLLFSAKETLYKAHQITLSQAKCTSVDLQKKQLTLTLLTASAIKNYQINFQILPEYILTYFYDLSLTI
jgi:4'-phosphopantetheinyl transferase EntD